MKKQIRQGVFETNSSSTHSICIAKDALLELPKELHFEFGEFGWEQSTLDSLHEKASYLYTGLIAEKRKEDLDRIIELLKSKGIEVTVEEAVYEDRSYKDSEGKLVEYKSGVNVGYIDHSNDLQDFHDAICSDDDKLMRFLFSPLSLVNTGNDNGGDEERNSFSVSYEHDEYYKGN